MSAIAQAIESRCMQLLELIIEQGAQTHELRQLSDKLGISSVRDCVAQIQGSQTGIQSLANWIKVDLAAARMTGQIAPATTAKQLELHPANLMLEGLDGDQEQEIWTGERILPRRTLTPAELERMQRTLHRAGDHTQDSREGAA